MLSKNVQDTAKIAEVFLEKILKSRKDKLGATIVGLSGELGAGKTAFTQSIAKHLGVKKKVISPTFVIIKKYLIRPPRPSGTPPSQGEKYKFLFHIDAYRLKNEKELLHLGWEDIISNEEHLVFIEWPENVSKIMPAHARYIYISGNEKGHRNLKLK